ncbi:MAG: hypothetical protein ACT4PT_05695 [Methanobacteriota archaeon]
MAVKREQVAAATGIVALALAIATFVLVGQAGFMDEGVTETSAAEAAEMIREEERTVRIAGVTIALGGAFLLWFVGALASRLRLAEGGAGRLSGIVWSAGALWAFSWWLAAFFFSGAAELATYYRFDEGAKFAMLAAGGFLADPMIGFVPATLLLATFYLSRRTTVLPAWLGWLTGATALALLLAGVAPAFGTWLGMLAFLLPVWMVATSATLVKLS